MVINDKVAFVPIPKNASWSVEDTCIEYKLDLKYPSTLWENSIRFNSKNPEKHIHSTIDLLIDAYGTNLEYVCIIRDSTERFISAWKYFVSAMVKEMNEELGNSIKSRDNQFVMNFIKNNYTEFLNAYNSFETRKKILDKLVTELGISEKYTINEMFLKRYAIHIFSLISQYQWILNDKVTVKQFNLNKLDEFEIFMSEKLGFDFKLIHTNHNQLDYCAVTRTPELVEFVDKYIDGAVKRTKSII